MDPRTRSHGRGVVVVVALVLAAWALGWWTSLSPTENRIDAGVSATCVCKTEREEVDGSAGGKETHALHVPKLIEKRVKRLVAETLGVEELLVTPGASLVGDLGADSTDLVELVMALEGEFEIEIRDEYAGGFVRVRDINAYVAQPPLSGEKQATSLIEAPFLMAIEDVFSVANGEIVTGQVERGKVGVGDVVEIVGLLETTQTSVVAAVEMYRRPVDEGLPGESVGVILRDNVNLERGRVLAQPGSIAPYSRFKADVCMLTKDKNGRETPVFDGYRPQYHIRTTDITGTMHLPEGLKNLKPGEGTIVTIELGAPMALERGTLFRIREGGRNVGCGDVLKLIR